ncbi:hypothetical protein A0H81_12169 [Grifola frondosa]|uniref:Uncharacterized protein n=1 Tax=Grifola frondosa TaxID=5627 RepID=A0A1C7LT61_GRIFR|nr:hypothetical protein A0H81_12169 [Grifola frondosa]
MVNMPRLYSLSCGYLSLGSSRCKSQPMAATPAYQRYQTANPYEQEFGYSRAVRRGPFIFVSGTTSIDPASGKLLHPESAYEQARTIFAEIFKAIGALGGTKADVVRVRMREVRLAGGEGGNRGRRGRFVKTRYHDQCNVLRITKDRWNDLHYKLKIRYDGGYVNGVSGVYSSCRWLLKGPSYLFKKKSIAFRTSLSHALRMFAQWTTVSAWGGIHDGVYPLATAAIIKPLSLKVACTAPGGDRLRMEYLMKGAANEAVTVRRILALEVWKCERGCGACACPVPRRRAPLWRSSVHTVLPILANHLLEQSDVSS